MSTDRREFIRKSTTAVGVLALGSGAGCLGLGSEEEGNGSAGEGGGTGTPTDQATAGADGADGSAGEGRGTGTPTDEAGGGTDSGSSPWSWFPAPSAIDLNHYEAERVEPQPFREVEDTLPRETWFTLSGTWSPPGILGMDAADVTEGYRGENFWVYLGDYDRAEAEEITADAPVDYEATDHGSGFTIYSAEGVPEGHALGDRGAIFVRRMDRGVDEGNIIETILDSRFGEGPGYTDANAGVDSLFDALGGPPFVRARTHAPREETAPERGRFAGAVGWGLAATPGPEETSVTWAIAFEEPDDVAVEAVRTWTDAALGNFEVGSVSASDATVMVETTTATETFRANRDLVESEQSGQSSGS